MTPPRTVAGEARMCERSVARRWLFFPRPLRVFDCRGKRRLL